MAPKVPSVLHSTSQPEMQFHSGDDANPRAILEQCGEVHRALDQLDDQLNDLENAFGRTLRRPDISPSEVDRLSSQIMASYSTLVKRITNITSQDGSSNNKNATQVGKITRRLKTTFQRYRILEADFRRDSKQATKRQYRIVHPNAPNEEVEEAAANSNGPIFSEAVNLSSRYYVLF
jgi:syntaxin 1B/2/3